MDVLRLALACALVGSLSSGCSLVLGFEYRVEPGDAGIDAATDGRIDAGADGGELDAGEIDAGPTDASLDGGADGAPPDGGSAHCAPEGTPFEVRDDFVTVDSRVWVVDPPDRSGFRLAAPGVEIFVPPGALRDVASVLRTTRSRDLSGRDVVIHVADVSATEVEARLILVADDGTRATIAQREDALAVRALEHGVDVLGPPGISVAPWWRIRHRCDADPDAGVADAGSDAPFDLEFATSMDGVAWDVVWRTPIEGDFTAGHVDLTLTVIDDVTTAERHFVVDAIDVLP